MTLIPILRAESGACKPRPPESGTDGQRPTDPDTPGDRARRLAGLRRELAGTAPWFEAQIDAAEIWEAKP